MKKYLISIFLLGQLVCFSGLYAQSIELMPGTERIFADLQWLKTFDEERKWSLFSRTRATVDYEDNTNVFSGAYLNYTSSSGLGASMVGRIASSGAGSDMGIHYFKASSDFLLFALASTSLSSEFGFSMVFHCSLHSSAKERMEIIYELVELFSSFNKAGHTFSVQRIRLGIDKQGYQFGFALNLTGLGQEYVLTDTNPGIFVRKQF